jgi:hypothetical protein
MMKCLSEEIIVSGEQRRSLLKPYEKIALTKTKLILGNEAFLLKDIAEVFNDFNRFAGSSKLGFRLKNGRIIKGIIIKTVGDYLVGLGIVHLANMQRKTTDEWVVTINSLISNQKS